MNAIKIDHQTLYLAACIAAGRPITSEYTIVRKQELALWGERVLEALATQASDTTFDLQVTREA
jgi:hypothetical protein